MARKLDYMEKENIHHRSTNCRLCADEKIALRFSLAPTPPAEWYYKEKFKNLTVQTYPLDVYQCIECGHVQLVDIINPKALYKDYFYTTESSPGLKEYFKKSVDSLITDLNLRSDCLVIDIGSNDGTFLHNFLEFGIDVIGIEPSKIVADLAVEKGVLTINNFLNEEVVQTVLTEFRQADLITANNVFAHNDDLSKMASCIRSMLKPDGVFVFEVSNLYDTIFNRVFDFIYHEHLSYHSVKPLKKFMEANGMILFHVERTPSKGGTIRCYCQTDISTSRVSKTVDDYIKLEEEAGLYNPVTYSKFSQEINRVGMKFRNELIELKKNNKVIVGYGASATVTTLLYQFDVAHLIDFLVDDNPIRHFTFSPGHHIPVLPPSHIDKHKVDVVAILAWRFESQILARNQQRFEKKQILVPEIKSNYVSDTK